DGGQDDGVAGGDRGDLLGGLVGAGGGAAVVADGVADDGTAGEVGAARRRLGRRRLDRARRHRRRRGRRQARDAGVGRGEFVLGGGRPLAQPGLPLGPPLVVAVAQGGLLVQLEGPRRVPAALRP